KLFRIGFKLSAGFVKLATFFVEPVKFLFAPLIKSCVSRAAKAAAKRRAIFFATIAKSAEYRIGLLVHITLEAIETIAPDNIGEHRKTKWPEKDEAKNH